MLNSIKNTFYGLKLSTFFKLLPDNEVVILKTTFNNFYNACIKYLSKRFNFTNSPQKLLSIFLFNQKMFTFEELLDTLKNLHIEINDNDLLKEY